MRERSMKAPWAKALAVLFALPTAPAATPAEDAAHRLAETFAGAHATDAERARAKAQREELARRAAEAARRAFEAERAQRRTDEAEMLARARAEAEARWAEEARTSVEAQRAEEARQLADKLRQARDAEAERTVREAEARRSGQPDEPSESTGPALETDETYPAPIAPTPPDIRDAAEPPRPPHQPVRRMANTHATVLLLMEPGSRGIRRWNKTADPMLCIGDTCYVSTGAAGPVTALNRAKAFGPGVALGSRAGACRNALGCVFRGVRLDRPITSMQPIDLRILRHDRREIREVTADETCRLTRGVLSCRAPVRADTYRAWIVPEDLAELAGPEALAAAVASGLPDEVSVRR